METRGGLGDGNSIARLSPRLFVHVLKVQLHGQLKNSVRTRQLKSKEVEATEEELTVSGLTSVTCVRPSRL